MGKDTKVKILFFAAEDFAADSAQVVRIVNEIELVLKSKGKCGLLILESIHVFLRNTILGRRSLIRFKDKNLQIIVLPCLLRRFTSVNKRLLRLSLRILLKKWSDSKIYLHCHRHYPAYLGILSKKKDRIINSRVKIIFDFHGVDPEEYLVLGGGRANIKVYQQRKSRERELVTNADKIICVSNRFKEYVVSEYSTDSGKIAVLPCCVDKSKFYYDRQIRREMRVKLGVENKVVIVYSGSMSTWQMPETMIKLFKAINSFYKNAYFLVLSPDIVKAKSLLEKHEVPREMYSLMHVPHDQVSRYLMAADIALLIRKRMLVNKIASPTKFAEYLRCGLAVLCTPDIGDFSDIVSSDPRIGMVIDIDSNNEEIIAKFSTLLSAGLNEAMRAYRSKLAGELLSWENYSNCLLEVYEGENV